MIIMKNIKKETMQADMNQLNIREWALCFHQIPRNSISNVDQSRGTSLGPSAGPTCSTRGCISNIS